MDIPIVGDHPVVPHRNKLLYKKEVGEYEYIQQSFLNKPSGFEYTLGDGWLTVPGYKNVEGYYLYALTLKDDDFIDIRHAPDVDKILTINTLEDLLHFELLFKCSTFGEIKIDWPSVAGRYGGIEFGYDCFNDKTQPRSTWYNDLDATRGFIWSPDVLSRVVLDKALDGYDLIRFYKEHGGPIDRGHNKKLYKQTPEKNSLELLLINMWSDLPSYVDKTKSTIRSSTEAERIMVLTKDGAPVKVKNEVVDLFEFDENQRYATYEFYMGDVSRLKPKEGFRLVRVDTKYEYTDIRYRHRNSILKIETYGDLLQLYVGYSNLIHGDKYYIYDKVIIDFDLLQQDFGGIEIDIPIYEPKFNQKLGDELVQLRVKSGGVVWYEDLITKLTI